MHRLSMCHLLTVVLLSADVFFAPSASAQNGQTQSSAVPLNSSQPGPASSATEDAATKAAERKKRFEEAKKRLENSAPQPQSGTASSSSSSCSYSQSDLSLSPALVNMVVGNTQGFSLFDLAGHKLTAQANWSVSDSSIAEIRVEGGEPVLTSKEKGTVRVQARVDSHSAESTVNVIAPEDMKPGTIRWSTPSSPCSKTTKIIPAVPH